MGKTCIMLNYAAHYRSSVFTAMDKSLDCDFVFGDKVEGNIKKMNYGLLSNFKKEVKNIKFKFSPFYYQKGSLNFLSKDYDYYLLSGELYNLSVWFILIWGRLFNKKVYLWSHGFYGNESKLKKVIKKIFFSLSKEIFLYGHYSKNIMMSLGFVDENIHVIYNSLNYEDQLPLRNGLVCSDLYKEYFKNTNKNLIFVGRLTKIKELDLLLKALKELKAKEVYYNLILVGEGVEKEYLEQLVSEFDLKSSVWFYGSCYDENALSKLIFNSDLCVSPGNIGLTAIHSMMFGTPVLTHGDFSKQMPEFETVVPGETGIFFEYGNVIELAKSIQDWFSTELSREQIRQNCYKIIDEKYNATNQLKIFRKVLK